MPNGSTAAADQGRRRSDVLGVAVVRAAKELGLTPETLARVIGVSAASVSDLENGSCPLDPEGHAFDRAAFLVRLFQALDAITGGDERANKEWMRNENVALGDKPMDLIQKETGLKRVLDYLESQHALT